MPLSNTRELKEDVLFRAGEALTGSSWDSKAIDYLNRVYRALAAGASEFLPEYVDDWWWMRAEGSLLLEPVYYDGAIQATYGSTGIVFSSAPAESLAGRKLRISDHPELFIIATHTAASVNATLDQPWTGDDETAAIFQAMKVEYELDAEAQVLISPMVSYQSQNRIMGLAPERMDELYPPLALQPGIPEAFSLKNDTLIQFSHGGRTDGKAMRIDYRYRPMVEDLTDSAMSVPLVPAQWMHVLADMALVYVHLDKNDDRSNAAALGARTNLGAMLKENRRRNVKIDHKAGHITPRLANPPGIRGPRVGRL